MGAGEDTLRLEGPSLPPNRLGWGKARGFEGRFSPYGVYYKLLSSCKD